MVKEAMVAQEMNGFSKRNKEGVMLWMVVAIEKNEPEKIVVEIVRLMSDYLTDAQTSAFAALVAPWQKTHRRSFGTGYSLRYVSFDHGERVIVLYFEELWNCPIWWPDESRSRKKNDGPEMPKTYYPIPAVELDPS